jgi:hypothetical protein
MMMIDTFDEFPRPQVRSGRAGRRDVNEALAGGALPRDVTPARPAGSEPRRSFHGGDREQGDNLLMFMSALVVVVVVVVAAAAGRSTVTPV